MFKKNADKSFRELDKLRKSLDSILQDLRSEAPEDILKFQYSDMSDYFKNIKIELIRKRKEALLFPGKPSDYIIKSGAASDYDNSTMHDSFPLFYMSGIYKARNLYSDKDYFGVRLNGDVVPAAYIKHLNSDNYKVYINHDVVTRMDKETFKRLIAATSIKLSDYKSISD
ncbi:MAG: hypothetical protein QXL94_01265 [Candidatus Parvarchaeum sp.]